MPITPLHKLAPGRFGTAPILKRLNIASRNLAELKGVAASIPNQNILINTLTLQTALRDSAGRLVYEPPQDANEVARLMHELERFIHDEPSFQVDPLSSTCCTW